MRVVGLETGGWVGSGKTGGVGGQHCDTELESGIRISEIPRFTGKSAEYGIPIAIQCRYGTQYGIPHSRRIAIRNRNLELRVTLCPSLTTTQVPNRPCECSDKNCWAANLLVDVMLEHFLSVHIVKGSYPNPSSIYSPADETVGGIQAERSSSSNDMLSHMFCLT